MFPSTVDWRITSLCDMHCPFCCSSNNIESMDKDNALKTIEILQNIGIKTINICGGEPLLYPPIVKVMKEIYSRNIAVLLSTNGNLYFKYIKKIEKYITKLSLPLDGYSAEIHSLNGRTESNYNNVLSILKYYVAHPKNFKIKISTLLTSQNIFIENNLSKIYKLLTNYPIDIWKIYELLPEGRAVHNYKLLEYSNELFKLITETFIKKLKDKSKIKIIFLNRNERNLCYFIIQPNGDVVIPEDSTVINEKILGNILIDPINSLLTKWQNLVIYQNYSRNIRL